MNNYCKFYTITVARTWLSNNWNKTTRNRWVIARKRFLWSWKKAKRSALRTDRSRRKTKRKEKERRKANGTKEQVDVYNREDFALFRQRPETRSSIRLRDHGVACKGRGTAAQSFRNRPVTVLRVARGIHARSPLIVQPMCVCARVCENRLVFVTGGHTIKRRRRVNEITPVSRFRPTGRNKLEPADSNRSLPLRNTVVKNTVEEVEEFIAFPNLKYILQRSSWMKLEEIEVVSKLDRCLMKITYGSSLIKSRCILEKTRERYYSEEVEIRWNFQQFGEKYTCISIWKLVSFKHGKVRSSKTIKGRNHRTRYVPWKERKSYYSSQNGAVQLTVPTDPETRMLFNRVYKSYEY